MMTKLYIGDLLYIIVDNNKRCSPRNYIGNNDYSDFNHSIFYTDCHILKTMIWDDYIFHAYINE